MSECSGLPLKVYAVDVNISMTGITPQGKSFGTILFVTAQALGVGTSGLSATVRTKSYFTAQAVEAEFGSSHEVYAAAVTAFSQEKAPLFIKVGLALAGESINDALDAIEAYDCDFYGIAIGRTWRDQTAVYDALGTWAATRQVLIGVVTNQAAVLNANLATATSTINLWTLPRKRIFAEYTSDALAFPEMATLVNCLTRDFDNENSYYTSKFKNHVGIAAQKLTGQQYISLTGFIAGYGLDKAQGRFINTVINSQTPTHVEGVCLDGTFIDQVHYLDWLKQSFQMAVFTEQKNTAQIPYTDQGFGQLGMAVQRVIKRGIRNGGLMATKTDSNGAIVPANSVTVPPRSTVSATQATQRVMPEMKVSLMLAGAIHYASVNANAGVI